MIDLPALLPLDEVDVVGLLAARLHVDLYIYIYIYIVMHIHIYIYIYMFAITYMRKSGWLRLGWLKMDRC